MITRAEKRFIRSWQEQREGGKWSYYLLYTFAGGFIISILTYIVFLWVLQVRVPKPYWMVPSIGVALACILSIFAWWMNEKKFRSIIRREIRLGTSGENLN